MKNMAPPAILVSVLFALVISLPAIAAEPEAAAIAAVSKPASLEETTAFISTQWPEFVDSSVTYAAEGIASSLQDTLNSIRFKRCDVTIDRSLTSTYNGRKSSSLDQKYTFNLKQIDTVSTGFYHDAKEGYTRNGVALFAVIFESGAGISKVISDKSINYSHKSTEKRVEFGIKTQENATILVTAFERAIQSCREEGKAGKK